jgi:hypothetical protein
LWMNPYKSSIFGILFFQNKSTNRILVDRTANPDLGVLKSGFLRIWDLQIWIFNDSFCAIALKICEDLLDSWKQVESWKICWIRGQQFESNLLMSGFVLWCQNWIFKNPDSQIQHTYKALDSQFPAMILAPLELFSLDNFLSFN